MFHEILRFNWKLNRSSINMNHTFVNIFFKSSHYRSNNISVFFYSDQIPYIESGNDDYVAYDNEKGGVIETLKDTGVVDLDTEICSVPEWVSTKAMLTSWLADAIKYELWVGSGGSAAETIYCSDVPWPIGKALFAKNVYFIKQKLGITKDNAEQKEDEVSKFPVNFVSCIFFFFLFCLCVCEREIINYRVF